MTIVSFGNTLPLLNEADDRIYGDENNDFFSLQPSSVFDPGFNMPDNDRIEGILKRSGFQVSENYQRYPRIKEKVIIPFYSYGNNAGYYRSKPRLLGRPRTYFGYNPWNGDSYRSSNRYRY
ncbi:uncharacterized protein LOC132717790 [Ruditapes philippinarum]|uniref:uncharacterized protein LOC132717790 n=1 Tax=Ruditapes philippinarum TaxID=129788 RepID=UPI00295BB8CA|nr:uncharacterized protein LOC132717790 [Ruditapes philippinarum]